jgi:hypothetical protein
MRNAARYFFPRENASKVMTTQVITFRKARQCTASLLTYTNLMPSIPITQGAMEDGGPQPPFLGKHFPLPIPRCPLPKQFVIALLLLTRCLPVAASSLNPSYPESPSTFLPSPPTAYAFSPASLPPPPACPTALKTGTTIAGVVCENAVVLAADTR